jgi:hypothetical protein
MDALGEGLTNGLGAMMYSANGPEGRINASAVARFWPLMDIYFVNTFNHEFCCL